MALAVRGAPARRLRLWFAILGAPAAWALQGLAGAALGGAGCIGHAGVAGLTAGELRALVIGISIVTLLVALAALVAGIAAWRRSADRSLTSMQGRARPDFLAETAMLVGFVFTLAILIALLPAIVLPACEVVR